MSASATAVGGSGPRLDSNDSFLSGEAEGGIGADKMRPNYQLIFARLRGYILGGFADIE